MTRDDTTDTAIRHVCKKCLPWVAGERRGRDTSPHDDPVTCDVCGFEIQPEHMYYRVAYRQE